MAPRWGDVQPSLRRQTRHWEPPDASVEIAFYLLDGDRPDAGQRGTPQPGGASRRREPGACHIGGGDGRRERLGARSPRDRPAPRLGPRWGALRGTLLHRADHPWGEDEGPCLPRSARERRDVAGDAPRPWRGRFSEPRGGEILGGTGLRLCQFRLPRAAAGADAIHRLRCGDSRSARREAGGAGGCAECPVEFLVRRDGGGVPGRDPPRPGPSRRQGADRRLWNLGRRLSVLDDGRCRCPSEDDRPPLWQCRRHLSRPENPKKAGNRRSRSVRPGRLRPASGGP